MCAGRNRGASGCVLVARFVRQMRQWRETAPDCAKQDGDRVEQRSHFVEVEQHIGQIVNDAQ